MFTTTLIKTNVINTIQVDCESFIVSGYCSTERVGRHAYGFREKQERIAFPLDTLYTSHAIIASALQ